MTLHTRTSPRHLLAAALAVLAVTTGHAASTSDPLFREAQGSRQGIHAVMMGAACAGDRVVAVGERGLILWSDDAGTKWHQAVSPTSVTLTSVRFADAHNGWAVGHGGAVLATHDGGQSWQMQMDGRELALRAMAGAQQRNDNQALKEAMRLVHDGPDKPFLDLEVSDAQHAVAVGAYNIAIQTADGGRSWQSIGWRLDNPKALHLYAVRARGNTMLIAGEEGLVLLSDDRGEHFRRVTTPYAGSWFTAELPADREIVLAGLRGNLWRSVDDGATWSAVVAPSPQSFTASAVHIDAQGQTDVLLATQGGSLDRLRDGTLRAVPAPLLPPTGGLLSLPDGRLMALTFRGAIFVAASNETQE